MVEAVETDFSDWKTANGRTLNRWPLIHSKSLRG
jgi:hypothetical protein